MRVFRFLCFAFLFVFILMPSLGPARAEVITCDPDGNETTAADSFHVFRPGLQGQHLRWRDIEFMVDTTYFQTWSPAIVERAMDKLAGAMIDSSGFNAFGISATRFRLLWDYLRRTGLPYSSNPQDSTAIVIGGVSDPARDRSHLDLYLVHPTRSNVGGRGLSSFQENDEDRSTGHSSPLVLNSAELKGPGSSVFADTLGIGWTHPSAVASFLLSHEFQHKMGGAWSIAYDEMFSAGAEALSRHPNNVVQLDFPYTVSLLGGDYQHPGTDSLVRFSDNNYQARSSFMAYLAYNFRGADTSATLSATADDLMRLWIQSPSERNLAALRDLLSDATCGTCAARSYMPESMPNRLRLGLLLHNWRVASYVNSPYLDEGQYGFSDIRLFGIPFSPWRHLGAWTANDPYGDNDINCIPPEVVLDGSNVTRSTVADQQRTHGSVSYPMALRPFGSEYWVVRAHPSVASSGQDLHVRVAPVAFTLAAERALCGVGSLPDTSDASFWVSVVAYRTAGLSDTLWMHPEWAHRVYGPMRVDLDSLRGPFDFFVPSFGDSFSAAVVVITLGDGPRQYFSRSGGIGYAEWQRYQVEFGLRRSPGPVQAVTPLAATPAVWESDPTWAPGSDTLLAYTRADGGATQIYLRGLSGAYHQKLMASSKNQRAPDWSPRGDWLAFVERCATGQCEKVVLRNRLTGDWKTLDSSSTGATAIEAAFSPTGQQLAYTKHIAFGGSAGVYLRRIGLYGQQDSVLLKRATTDRVSSLRWSPDGASVFFIANDSLYSVGALGASLGKVTALPSVLASAAAFDLPANGSRIAMEESGATVWYYTCSSEPYPQYVPYRRVALRDTTASDTIVTTYRAGASYYRPRLSPSNTLMAWSTNQDDSTDRDVYVGPVSWNHAPAFAMSVNDTTLENGPGAYIIRDWNATDADGESPTFAVVGLPSGATFNNSTGEFYWAHPSLDTAYVVFRALDGSGGVDQRVVRYRSFPAVAPDTVVDFSPEIITSTTMTFFWTAPGDDDNTGTATEYDIRWSSAPITESNWVGAYQLDGEPAPDTAGTIETHGTLTNLQPCTWYYIGIRTRDEAHNWSAIATTHARTLCGGWGGGGESASGDLEVGAAPGATSEMLSGESSSSGRQLAIESVPNETGPLWRSYFVDRAVEDTTAIAVQTPGARGEWTTIAAIGDSVSGELGLWAGAGARRYLFSPRFTLRGLASALALPGNQTVAIAELTNSRLGALESPDAIRGSIADGDTVTVRYAAASGVTDADGTFAFFSGGPRSAQAGARSERSAPAPRAFALYQSQPNPFRSDVAIRFDLPAETRVKLTIHDIQGRLVRLLADRRAPAGQHTLQWDRRTDSGHAVAPGVYLYQLEAGAYRARKKMVALP